MKIANYFQLPKEKILPDCVVCIPGFTLKKYLVLKDSSLSIFSIRCFGGILYHTLGLPFLSPFVNMFLSENDYMNFLKIPQDYLKEDIIFKDKAFNDANKFYYPIFTLNGIELNMNHYPDFNEAVVKWNQRKKRINWYNLFVTAYTESQEFAEQFDKLPYGKKVCFVPFKSSLNSSWYINPNIRKDLNGFAAIVNRFAMGQPFYYDVFDMLLYGKKTQLIDM